MATGNAALDNVGRYFMAPSDNRMILCGLSFFHSCSVYTLIGTAKIGQRRRPLVAF